MSFRRAPFNVIPAGTTTIGASVTDSQLGREFGITNGHSLRVDLVHAAATVAVGITLKLQVMVGLAADDSEVWVDSKTATVVNSSTSTTLTLLAEAADDQEFLPLPGKGRLVVTTGAGDSVVISSALLFQ